MDHAIWAEGLVKRFGDTTALAGVDLAVRTGTVLGLLGPNGAGKTTTVRVLATLLQPDGGHATVGGHDVVRDAHRVRQLIGLTGQYASVDEALTGAENLLLIGRLLGVPRPDARARARELLGRFDLQDAADRAAKTYSGGMRRRLDLAASLVGRPRLLYLDEPTAGLDPRSRLELWDLVRGLVADGVFVLLFTYVFGGAIAGSPGRYLTFALPGIIVMNMLFVTMYVGLGLNTDLTKGVFDRLRSLPVARWAPLAGRITADLVKQAWSIALLLVVGTILGFRIGTSALALLGAVGLLLVFALAFSWVSVLIGMLAKDPEKVQLFGFTALFPITFVSNVFVPVKTMPGWLQAFVAANPVTILADATRGLMVGGPVAGPA